MAKKKEASSIKQDVIDQWIEDLRDPDFGIVFNADFTIALTSKGKVTGDAALYLALRNADVDPQDIFGWYEKLEIPPGGYHCSEIIIHKFTGIPLEDACKLAWPAELLNDPEFGMERLKAKFFVSVLKSYLKTGEVDWKQVYHLESSAAAAAAKRREKKAKNENTLSA